MRRIYNILRELRWLSILGLITVVAAVVVAVTFGMSALTVVIALCALGYVLVLLDK